MTIQKSILALQPMAYYPLQETAAGTIVDISGNGLDGLTVGSGIAYAQAGIWTPWPTQKLMTFPGASNGYVRIPNFPSMGGSHTYTAWVRRNNSSLTHQQIVGQQGSVGVDACTYLKVADSLAITLFAGINTIPISGGTFSKTSSTNLPGDARFTFNTGTSYFVAVVVDMSVSPGVLSLYLNGLLIATKTFAANSYPIPGKGDMNIGAGFYSNAVVDWAGASMAHVAFFSKALTAGDIARLYSVGTSNTGHTKVVGTVRNGAGIGVARIVRVYSRATGRLLGDTTSASDGTYSCPLYGGELEQVFVLALDDDTAPDYNAPIVDHQMPVGA